MIPDKPGLWWYDVKLIHKNCTPDSYFMVDVFYRRQWSGLTYQLPDGEIREVDENTRGFLGPVITHEQTDELQRHAAALEAQVTDLECTVVRLLHDRALDSDLNNPPLWECEHENMNEAMRDE